MAANQRVLEKEIGRPSQMIVASPDDWFEVMGGVGLKDTDRENFNCAFEFFVAGS